MVTRRPADRWVDSNGVARMRGGAELKATQSYPIEFGASHAVAFLDWEREHGTLAPAAGRSAAHAGTLAAAAGRSAAHAGMPASSIVSPDQPSSAGDASWVLALSDSDDEGGCWFLADLAGDRNHWEGAVARETQLPLKRPAS